MKNLTHEWKTINLGEITHTEVMSVPCGVLVRTILYRQENKYPEVVKSIALCFIPGVSIADFDIQEEK